MKRKIIISFLSLICIILLTLGIWSTIHLDKKDDNNINGTWCAVKFIMQSSGGIFSIKEAENLIGNKLIINNDVVKGFNSVCNKPNFEITEATVDYLKDSLSLFDSYGDQ